MWHIIYQFVDILYIHTILLIPDMQGVLLHGRGHDLPNTVYMDIPVYNVFWVASQIYFITSKSYFRQLFRLTSLFEDLRLYMKFVRPSD